MTRVKIKLKGQFYGMTGEIVKRQNQYLFGVKFDKIKGVYPFGHRSLEIVDPSPKIESDVLSNVGKNIERVIREVQAMVKATEMNLEHARKYQTDWAKATAKALEKELQDKREIDSMLNKILHR
jgi:alkyl hydroperoxide reductase subunit AhpC